MTIVQFSSEEYWKMSCSHLTIIYNVLQLVVKLTLMATIDPIQPHEATGEMNNSHQDVPPAPPPSVDIPVSTQDMSFASQIKKRELNISTW